MTVGEHVGGIHIPCIYDVGDVALPDGVGYLLAAVAQLADLVGAYPVLLEEERRALGGLDIEAHIVEAAYKRKRLFLILIRYGGKYRTVIHNAHSACLKRLVKRAGQLVIITYSFARGLHFGRKIRIKSPEL